MEERWRLKKEKEKQDIRNYKRRLKRNNKIKFKKKTKKKTSKKKVEDDKYTSGSSS